VATAGKCVVRDSGKVGMLSSARPAAFNAQGQCPACCITFTQTWSFTDQGFIAGGQNGALRSYTNPASVSASPWVILSGGLGLRLNWENDANCRSYNSHTQNATATAQISVPVNMVMTVGWSGLGERQDPNYELMSLRVDGALVGSAHAPGGGLGCASMGPVVSSPPPPQTRLLTAGLHTLTINATTNDANYHFGAYYQFNLSFAQA